MHNQILENDIKFKLQKEFCKENKLPHFAPKNCFRCHNNVYEKFDDEYCKTNLITGCRHCRYSFIE